MLNTAYVGTRTQIIFKKPALFPFILKKVPYHEAFGRRVPNAAVLDVSVIETMQDMPLGRALSSFIGVGDILYGCNTLSVLHPYGLCAGEKDPIDAMLAVFRSSYTKFDNAEWFIMDFIRFNDNSEDNIPSVPLGQSIGFNNNASQIHMFDEYGHVLIPDFARMQHSVGQGAVQFINFLQQFQTMRQVELQKGVMAAMPAKLAPSSTAPASSGVKKEEPSTIKQSPFQKTYSLKNTSPPNAMDPREMQRQRMEERMRLFQQQRRRRAGGAGMLGLGLPGMNDDDSDANDVSQPGVGGDEDIGDTENVSTFTEYKPKQMELGREHPDLVVQATSLHVANAPKLDYQLHLPREVIDEGRLSSLQLEAIAFACQKHRDYMSNGKRYGFFIGDGAGVGKGREVAGIVFENWALGNTKHIWFSASADLAHDARRDLDDLGADFINCYSIRDCTYDPLDSRQGGNIHEGVMFSTYATLTRASAGRSRLDQLIEWCGPDFSGCIIFDESHRAKNLIPKGKTTKASKTAEKVMEIQDRLPHARIIYCSATGASEPRNMGYMNRLGLWGEEAPFPSFGNFLEFIEQQGIAALEVLAMDLKRMGLFICRSLSFSGAQFITQQVSQADELHEQYDNAALFWQEALRAFKVAIGLCKDAQRPATTVLIPDKEDPRKLREFPAGRILGMYWGAHQRFFRGMCVALKVPDLIALAKAELAKQKCIVIGLQTTGEARTNDAVDAARKAGEEMDDFISTPQAVIRTVIEKFFPVLSVPPPHVNPNANGNGRRKANGGASPNSSDGGKDNGNDKKKSNNKKSNKNESESDSDSDFETQNSKRKTKKGRALRTPKKKVNYKERGVVDLLSDSELDLLTSESEQDDPNESECDSHIDSVVCSICKEDKDEDKVLICDGCDGGQHTYCCTPPLTRIPTGNWFCDQCERDGIDNDDGMDVEEVTEEVRDLQRASRRGINALSPALQPIARRLIEMREDLLKKVDELVLPLNPLDELLDALGGPEHVAEMTGRTRRLIRDPETGGMEYASRSGNGIALDKVNIEEKDAFMAGRKLVAIISEAASTGISLQADRRVPNQLRRVHITLETPWSADKAIQQFGRTHRSNQISAPEYVLLVSRIGGEMRFASAVAHRIASMGALTQGDRNAASGAALSEFDFENRLGRSALKHIENSIIQGKLVANLHHLDIPLEHLERMKEYFVHMDVEDKVGLGLRRGKKKKSGLTVSMFFNRLLGLPTDEQNDLFEFFVNAFDAAVVQAKRTDRYDEGVAEIPAANVEHTQAPEVIFTHPFNGSKTERLSIRVDRGLTFEGALMKLIVVFETLPTLLELVNQVGGFKHRDWDSNLERRDDEGKLLNADLESLKQAAPHVLEARYLWLKALPIDHDDYWTQNASDFEKYSIHRNGFYKSKNETRPVGHRVMASMIQLPSTFSNVTGMKARFGRPNTGFTGFQHNLAELRMHFDTVSLTECKRQWDVEYEYYKDHCTHREDCRCAIGCRVRPFDVITGTVYPVWPVIYDCMQTGSGTKRRLNVVRSPETDRHEAFIGLKINPDKCAMVAHVIRNQQHSINHSYQRLTTSMRQSIAPGASMDMEIQRLNAEREKNTNGTAPAGHMSTDRLCDVPASICDRQWVGKQPYKSFRLEFLTQIKRNCESRLKKLESTSALEKMQIQEQTEGSKWAPPAQDAKTIAKLQNKLRIVSELWEKPLSEWTFLDHISVKDEIQKKHPDWGRSNAVVKRLLNLNHRRKKNQTIDSFFGAQANRMSAEEEREMANFLVDDDEDIKVESKTTSNGSSEDEFESAFEDEDDADEEEEEEDMDYDSDDSSEGRKRKNKKNNKNKNNKKNILKKKKKKPIVESSESDSDSSSEEDAIFSQLRNLRKKKKDKRTGNTPNKTDKTTPKKKNTKSKTSAIEPLSANRPKRASKPVTRFGSESSEESKPKTKRRSTKNPPSYLDNDNSDSEYFDEDEEQEEQKEEEIKIKRRHSIKDILASDDENSNDDDDEEEEEPDTPEGQLLQDDDDEDDEILEDDNEKICLKPAVNMDNVDEEFNAIVHSGDEGFYDGNSPNASDSIIHSENEDGVGDMDIDQETMDIAAEIGDTSIKTENGEDTTLPSRVKTENTTYSSLSSHNNNSLNRNRKLPRLSGFARGSPTKRSTPLSEEQMIEELNVKLEPLADLKQQENEGEHEVEEFNDINDDDEEDTQFEEIHESNSNSPAEGQLPSAVSLPELSSPSKKRKLTNGQNGTVPEEPHSTIRRVCMNSVHKTLKHEPQAAAFVTQFFSKTEDEVESIRKLNKTSRIAAKRAMQQMIEKFFGDDDDNSLE